MKKLTIILISIALIITSLSAQNIVTKVGNSTVEGEFQIKINAGDVKIVFQGNGQVGIGTDAPNASSPPRLQRGGLTVGRLKRQLKGNLHPGSGVSNSGLFELETQTPNQKRGPFPLY